ncbi:SOS response-associated peptidase [Bacillota bacterium Meth-B3]|nr:SOS response-associated peptidase family protein [Christensenellaceae bacterium]MEA5064558.1 SOS response-associated peptidase family protein [Eubacteriales bacterium]MEA5068148.1 SOS response-associated peptidase family protein [Christensenellaceae bacterium]
MCGRYLVDFDAPALRGIIATLARLGDAPVKAGEVCPSDRAAVLTALGPRAMRWGFPMEGRRPVINARAETVRELPMFARALAERRAAVPARGFYEWRREGGRIRRKLLFELPGEEILYLAGMYDDFAAGGQAEPRFVILTTAANESMAAYHDRMPVLLRQTEVPLWLSGGAFVAQALGRVPFPLSVRPADGIEQLRLF